MSYSRFIFSLILMVCAANAKAQTNFDSPRKINVTFNQKNKRPPGPYDIMAQMERIIPFMSSTYNVDSDCLELNKQTATVVGSIMPDYGQPLESEPDGLFVKLYARCMAKVIDANLYNDGEVIQKNYKVILGDDLFTEILTAVHTLHPQPDVRSISNASWSEFSPDLQTRIMKRLIYYILGPESLLRYYKYIGVGNVFGQPLSNLDELIAFIEVRLISDKNRAPNFLYIFKSMVIMFRLGPALTN